MKVTSPRSTKTLAVFTGTLVVTCTSKVDTSDVAAFESVIDQCSTLQRMENATVREGEAVDELRCKVRYGPVLGAYGSDLLKQLKYNILPELCRIRPEFEVLSLAHVGVLFPERQEIGDDEVRQEITAFTTVVDDISVPIAVREKVSRIIQQLRKYLAENDEAVPLIDTGDPDGGDS